MTQGLNSDRRDYVEARRAIDRGHWAEYERLRPGLDDYPLAIYLDFFQLSRQVDSVGTAQAERFLSRSADTPLPNRFLSIYLREVGKAQQWNDFLQLMPGEPNSLDLKCYYFRAQLAAGNKEHAWQGARQLWVKGESLPAECDALLDAWQSSGGLTDALVWTRLLNLFDARQQALLQYVAGKSSVQMQPWVDSLLSVYRRPESLLDQSLPADNPYSADIASHGLVYLASSSPEKALAYWTGYQEQLRFDVEQVRRIEYAIAQQSLFSRTEANMDWLDRALVRLGDDRLVGIRLRWALSQQDWVAVERNLPLLSASAREENVWRYWQAMLSARAGDTTSANAALEQLAGERDYYGFLAADKLGRPYAFNHQPLAMTDASPVLHLPVVQRIEELNFHREDRLAQSEWVKVLQDTADRRQQQDLALLATQKGWPRMAIDAATRAEAWNALDQRFPTPYLDVFKQYASARQVPDTELMAIARRESAFFPAALSPVGARGLMQIMPATAELVSSTLQQPYKGPELFDVEHNVMLGSAYYRQLLDRFDGNRIFALTAYNAGPHRVERWRHAAGEGIPVELWIETIPYQETRNYVQAVLSYNVVFQYLVGDTQRLLTPLERQASY
ncbi:MAG TPA: transglycosylase SLT domain-containing protein [Halioglobus sp.]